MSSSFFIPLGLHNKFTKFTGCQVLTVAFSYTKIGRARQVLRVSSFVAAASYGSCQILNELQLQLEAGPGSCGQNLKKLEIYDIIKGWAYRPAQKIQSVSNFAIFSKSCYNIYVR